MANELPDVLPLLLRGSWTRHTSGFRDTKWDLALCLTDLPLRRDDGEVIVAELDCSRRVALISVPAVGGMNLRRRLHSLLVPLVAHLRGRQQAGDIAEHGRYRVHNGEQDEKSRSGCRAERACCGCSPAWSGPIGRGGSSSGLSTALAGALTGTAFGGCCTRASGCRPRPWAPSGWRARRWPPSWCWGVGSS